MNDLTPRDDRITETEERMRSVLDHVLDGIITIDAAGRIESFNPAAEKLFGYGRDEVLGHNVKMLMPEPYHGEHDRYLESYLRTGKAKIIGIGREVVGRRKDGSTFPMDLAVSEFHIRGQRYFTGIVRDVTERKELEDQLRQRVDDLAQADRQKNEFLAMLAHELRNPLGPMRNALYLMGMPQADAAAVAGARDIMERQLQQIVRLVDDLLDISRIIRGKIELRRERIDLADALRRAVETSGPLLDARGQSLELTLPDEPVPVMGDAIRLAQVVSNLLNNAAKYSTRPGRIGLELERQGGEAVIVVRDEGEGIAPELLPHVFELFVQGDHTLARLQGGLGIGLTLVKRLVEMHDGEVSAASAGRGKGSEFRIRLPLSQESRPAARGGAGESPAGGRSRRVLVVDDNVDAVDSIARVLRLFGHEVASAHDGPSALARAADFLPEVIVLDIGLPGMDGYEVARRLRAMPAFRRTLIVAATGYGQEDDRRRSRQAGFDHHLTKPVDPEQLRSIIAAGGAHGLAHPPPG
jgi:PAS domain S-box-containing protein